MHAHEDENHNDDGSVCDGDDDDVCDKPSKSRSKKERSGWSMCRSCCGTPWKECDGGHDDDDEEMSDNERNDEECIYKAEAALAALAAVAKRAIAAVVVSNVHNSAVQQDYDFQH